jgi:hypothetical protein
MHRNQESMNNSEIKESKHKEMKYGPARFQFNVDHKIQTKTTPHNSREKRVNNAKIDHESLKKKIKEDSERKHLVRYPACLFFL